MTEILVLGAGMVGVSTALALQARGHDVTLVDRAAPGRETSFGNAGVIQAEAAEPYALPRDARTLLSIVMRRSNDVSWTLPGLLRMVPALRAYHRHSTPARHAEISRTYAQLVARATADHAPLIEASGTGNLVAREGLALLYRNARAFDRDTTDAARIRDSFGLPFRAVPGEDWRHEEPALTRAPAGVIHWTDSWSCSDPGALVAGYADLFARRGGRLVRADATTLRRAGAGWAVESPEGRIEGRDAVIALGPWSPLILRRFGYRVPMIYKRGYHGHFASPRPLRRPFVDTANGVVASTMSPGLRITTGAAIVSQDAPPDLRQLTRGRNALSDFLEIGPRVDEPQWSGTRPCLPDMLPLVGPAPRDPGLWFNVGHGHQGFTLGPTTAHLLAEAHAGDRPQLIDKLSPGGRL